MDTRLLGTFVSLARTGTFTATATELHLAQSTVTVQIRTLERDLRTTLFDRLPSGAMLTDAGRRLLGPAEQVLAAEAELRQSASVDRPITGQVSVGAPDSLCAVLLPATIAALRHTHPGVDVRLTPASTADAVDRLRTGKLSVAVVLETTLAEPDLTVTELGRLDLVLLAGPGHPAAGRQLDWPGLAEEEFYLLEEGCVYSDQLAGLLRAQSAVLPRVTRLGSVEAARACVAAGLGLTLLPEVTVADQVASGQLVPVPGPAFPSVPVWLAHHRRRAPGPAHQAVLDALRAQKAL